MRIEIPVSITTCLHIMQWPRYACLMGENERSFCKSYYCITLFSGEVGMSYHEGDNLYIANKKHTLFETWSFSNAACTLCTSAVWTLMMNAGNSSVFLMQLCCSSPSVHHTNE